MSQLEPITIFLSLFFKERKKEMALDGSMHVAVKVSHMDLSFARDVTV